MRCLKPVRVIALLVCMVTVAGSAQGKDIDIVNPGFEYSLDVTFPGDYDPNVTGGDEGWFQGYYDHQGEADPTVWVGQQNDASSMIWWADAVDGYTAGAPEGHNTAGFQSTAGMLDPLESRSEGFRQVLTDTLTANVVYTLSAKVGNPIYNQSDTTADYRMELLAGGVVLATDSGTSPAADTWDTHALSYVAGATDPLLGRPLEIRLVANSFTDGTRDWFAIDFDDVKLTKYLLGDANRDDDVDVWAIDGTGDAQVLTGNLGTMIGASWQDGDFNGDGDVDVWAADGSGDAQALMANLGATFDAASLFEPPSQSMGNVLAYFNTAGFPVGEYSVGLVLRPGLAQHDISFSYTPIGGKTTTKPVTMAPVPEPSTVTMLVVMGILGILGRRQARNPSK